MKKLILIAVLLLLVNLGFAQLKINEVCSRNANTASDEDGDHPDWIEIYNQGSSTVNLLDYMLSDDPAKPSKWSFPSYDLAPQKYVTIFASGKDKTSTIDHWGSVVQAEMVWRYFLPTTSIGTNWTKASYNDVSWPSGTGGWGYGDGDDNTVLPNPTVTVYVRMPFIVMDTAVIGSAFLHMDYDDGFVMYLNGKELTRANIGITGQPPAVEDLAYEEHEALMYQGMTPEGFFISEKDLKQAITNGINILAVEVHNNDSLSDDMTCRPYLTFAIKDNSTFYINPPAWFNAGNSWMHTNFKLSGAGETVLISDPLNVVLDSLSYPYTQLDNSFGRQNDGMANTFIFSQPTPNKTNNNSSAYSGYISEPIFTLSPGFYPSTQTLSLLPGTVGSDIHFTTNGTKPDINSPIYSSSLSVDSTMVVRARAYALNLLPSEVITNTYFIDEYSTLPSISISTAPGYFFDWDTGIYVAGPNAKPQVPHFGANYWQDWEVPIHMEYFAPNGQQQFEQDLGCKINGGWSRSHDQKSLRILARSEYGKSTIDYQLFPDKPIYSFKRFLLRNSGNETNVVHFRDGLEQKNVQFETNNEIQDYKPAVVYINGAYWGVYNMREKISRFYLAENHPGVNPDKVNLLQFSGYVIEGNNTGFLSMYDFITTNNMAVSANYNLVNQVLDIENFCDHFITETYYVNHDWPQNNIKYWQDPVSNSKWRYILTDLDFGLGLAGTFSENDLHRARIATNNYHSKMFNSLLSNIDFRNYFINRYADLMNTIFTPQHLTEKAFAFRDTIYPEMPKHFARWYSNMNTWLNYNIGIRLIDFIHYRPQYARAYIQQEFGLAKQVPITLNVYPEGAGTIQINTIEPDSFPWGGIYYDGVPITISARPNPGYEFSFWESGILIPGQDTNKSITLNLDTTDYFTAYFYGSPDSAGIAFSEINYNSGLNYQGADWVEIHNYGSVDIDISGWIFKDSNDLHQFILPPATMLKKNQYLVLAKDTAQFRAAYPAVNNIVGPFSFGLSSAGEDLRLFDERGNMQAEASYLVSPPWPLLPNGQGSTLERIDFYNNPNNSGSWFSGCEGGSPGEAFIPCYTAIGLHPDDQSSMHLSNYPNPFSDQSTLSFVLDQGQDVKIELFDIYGQKVDDILHAYLPPGTHYFPMRAGQLSPGIYYCRVKAGNQISTRAVQILKH